MCLAVLQFYLLNLALWRGGTGWTPRLGQSEGFPKISGLKERGGQWPGGEEGWSGAKSRWG